MFYPKNFLRVLGKGATEKTQLLKLWADVDAYYVDKDCFETPWQTPCIEWIKTTDWYAQGGYKECRAAEYPTLEDQADMAFHDRQDGTAVLDTTLIAVKAKWEKPC